MNWRTILAKSLIKDYYKEDKQRQFHTPNILERPKINMTAIRIRPPGQLGKKPIRMGIGPGEPPNGFVLPGTSRPEWILYWALWQVLHEEGDVRQPPFYGGQKFRYQVAINGGRRSMGGNITDFVVDWAGRSVALWLQGDRQHLEAGPERNAIDLDLMMNNSQYMDVRAIYEINLIADPTGEQACRTTVETLGGRRFANPAKTGQYRPTRLGTLYGGRP
jgi:hypothetical protein